MILSQGPAPQPTASATAAAAASAASSGGALAATPQTAPTQPATQTSAPAAAALASAVRMVPVQITVPAQAGVPNSVGKSITVQVPAHALQGGAGGAQLQAVLSSPSVTAALSLPVELATTVLQQHINAALQVFNLLFLHTAGFA